MVFIFVAPCYLLCLILINSFLKYRMRLYMLCLSRRYKVLDNLRLQNEAEMHRISKSLLLCSVHMASYSTIVNISRSNPKAGALSQSVKHLPNESDYLNLILSTYIKSLQRLEVCNAENAESGGPLEFTGQTS